MQEPSLSGCKYFPLIQQASLGLRADSGLFVESLARSVSVVKVKVRVTRPHELLRSLLAELKKHKHRATFK